MQLTDPSRFLRLGGVLRYLVGAGDAGGYRLNGTNYVLDNLMALRRRLESLDFSVSVNMFDMTLQEYVESFQALIQEHEENEHDEDDVVVVMPDDVAKPLRDCLVAIENTVMAEAKLRMIAVPTARRIAIEQLFNSPETLLGSNVHGSLTSLATEDWSAACRCLAFECCTGAAFHCLRAVEECVRILYTAYFPRRAINNRPWGLLTNELANKPRRPRPDPTLITHLDHIRRQFRNPTDHPEKVYDAEEAEDLIHLAADVINRCMRDDRVVARMTPSED